MIFLILVSTIFYSGYSFQTKYDYCKSIEFKGDYCKTQKKLKKYER